MAFEGREQGRLAFRPRTSSGTSAARHEQLGLGDVRDGVLYVPDTVGEKAPILVFLHGATGSGRAHMRPVLGAVDRYGVILVAPDSQLGDTWDLIVERRIGPDVAFLDQVLESVVERVDGDTSRLALGGVSDGASYALSVGLSNGDVFSTVIAFSPGFLAVPEPIGRPRVFISHGVRDSILPIDMCSRVFAPALRDAGYEVMFHEFDGGHTVPPAVADQAIAWWLNPSPPSTSA